VRFDVQPVLTCTVLGIDVIFLHPTLFTSPTVFSSQVSLPTVSRPLQHRTFCVETLLLALLLYLNDFQQILVPRHDVVSLSVPYFQPLFN